MFLCGTGNFPHNGADDDAAKPSRRPPTKNNHNNNPYADRGLDKFYALLADLDDRKQKIYTRMGSEDISFVRFVYANDDSNLVKPIVVKVKDKTHQKNANTTTRKTKNDPNNPPVVKRPPSENPIPIENKDAILPEQKKSEEICKKRRKKYTIRSNEERITIPSSWINRFKQQPCWYFPAVVVLIMVLLAVFGRSFAILCTSIGWYLVPTVAAGEGSSSAAAAAVERKPKRKKEDTKKAISFPKMMKNLQVGPDDQASPISVINSLPNNRKIQKLQHGKKKKLLKLSTF